MASDHAPVFTPLPAAPSGDFMDQTQWDVLFALVDGALPSIAAASAVTDEASQISVPDADFEKTLALAALAELDVRSPDALAAFLAYRSSQDPTFRDEVLRTLAASPRRDQLAKAMGFMATRLGSLLMTGYWTPVHQQPARVREAILKSWINSYFLGFRTLGKTMSSLAQKSDNVTSPYLNSLLGYSDTPKDWKAGLAYDYKFLQIAPGSGNEPHVINTDIVIVGSGCGGAVCAKNLAELGHKVLVVDKGYYFPPQQLPMTQFAGTRHLYESEGAYLTEDGGSTSVLSGGSWGGGGTVNWGVCLKPQDFVRKEWAAQGLPIFTSSDFDDCIDRVCEFAGVTTDGVRHNHRNRVLLDGCAKLGWKAAAAPRNSAGKEHYCGQCHLGCGSAEKRGPSVTWLPAAGQAGAQFMEGFKVDEVLFDESNGDVAIGIAGLWTARGPNGELHEPTSARTQRRVVVNASKVIVSAGSLRSPILLLKSGVENPHVGRNLHIHPCNFLTATYKEDIRSWEGGIITSYCSEFENLDEEGHGVKLEPTSAVPYTCLSVRPWKSGLDFKLNLLKYRHKDTYISLTRDRDSGRVFPDPTSGEPRIDYSPSDFDRAHTLEGVVALAKMCYVAGAVELEPVLPGIEPFVPAHRTEEVVEDEEKVKDPELTDGDFAKWLQRLRTVGNRPPTAPYTSAHQMGSCRMSATKDEGVVDEKGRVWGKKNLYVADASVFPSASGVNPMLTTMAVSDWISRCVAAELASK